jgi:hypothetical protein
MGEWGGQVGKGKEGKISVHIIVAVVNHDITPFLTLRLPCLMTPRLPLRLHGLHTLHPPRWGCVLQVEGPRQGGGDGRDNPRRRWRGDGAPGNEWWCGI